MREKKNKYRIFEQIKMAFGHFFFDSQTEQTNVVNSLLMYYKIIHEYIQNNEMNRRNFSEDNSWSFFFKYSKIVWKSEKKSTNSIIFG